MAFIERDDMAEHLAANAIYPAIRDSVLAGASAELRVMIEQRVTEAAWQRHNLPQWLHDPVTGRIRVQLKYSIRRPPYSMSKKQ
ncbi:MAG TPA: hypothetical protein VEX68_23995 [Bryobacteraceae bacterium]|nr:hypothetical protein [Bryobacteraceae bacterium]